MGRTTVPFVVSCITILTAGCLPYPVYKTLQPQAKVKVVDQDGEPIEGVEVSLISSSYPYGFEKSRETRTTDSQGLAEFEKQKEWRIEALMIHGSEVFFWNWCIRKEGFETLHTAHRSADDFQRNRLVVLQPGETTGCAEPIY